MPKKIQKKYLTTKFSNIIRVCLIDAVIF